MFGEHGPHAGGGRALPRVVEIAVDRVGPVRPPVDAPVPLIVSIHEEGTALTWRRSTKITPAQASQLIDRTAALHRWARGRVGSEAAAHRHVAAMARSLNRRILGDAGMAVLRSLSPTAILLAVDESLLNLPWEIMRTQHGGLPPQVPLGRIVSTGIVPAARRDPLAEDATLQILVVANPTDDLAATDAEVQAITALEGTHGSVTVTVTSLRRRSATRAGFAKAVRGQSYDIIHFAGHAAFDDADPHESALFLADGPMAAGEVAALPWAAPPYIVFNSACESARAARGRSLVARGQANGLAAAFLAEGSEAYIGHFWPVDDTVAGTFAGTFYAALLEARNVGTAITEARMIVDHSFSESADLAGIGAVFFGDAGTAERRDLATAV